MMYSVLFFLCFGSSSKVLRGLGDDHPIRLSSSAHSMFAQEEKAGDEFIFFEKPRNCPLDTKCINSVDAALGFVNICGDPGEKCDNCMTKNYMYYSQDNQAKKEKVKLKLMKEDNTLVDIDYAAEACREKCVRYLEEGKFACKWWVMRYELLSCMLWTARPNKYRATTCDPGTTGSDCRRAGPPCAAGQR